MNIIEWCNYLDQIVCFSRQNNKLKLIYKLQPWMLLDVFLKTKNELEISSDMSCKFGWYWICFFWHQQQLLDSIDKAIRMHCPALRRSRHLHPNFWLIVQLNGFVFLIFFCISEICFFSVFLIFIFLYFRKHSRAMCIPTPRIDSSHCLTFLQWERLSPFVSKFQNLYVRHISKPS